MDCRYFMTSKWPLRNYSLGATFVNLVYLRIRLLSVITYHSILLDAPWINCSSNFNGLTYWGRDKLGAISQTTLSNEFSWMKPSDFRLKFPWDLSTGTVNNIPSLVQIMAWRRPGDKRLFEPMMIRFATHICFNELIEQEHDVRILD